MKCIMVTKRGEDLACRKCTKAFHLLCAGYTEAKPFKGDRAKWTCPDCAKPHTASTPTNQQHGSSSDGDIRVSLDEMNQKLAVMIKKLDDTNQKVTSLVQENNALKLELAKKEDTIRKMQARMDFFDQRLRVNNIEISNLPEKTGEDAREVVKTLIRAVGYKDIQDSDIQATHRVPKFNKTGSNIVVHLTSRWTRSKILQAVKNFKRTAKRNLSSKDVDNDLPQVPVYISEHLCPAYKLLLMKTKTFAQNKGYKYTWVQEGRILVKKSDQARQTYQIKTEEDLTKLQ